MINDNVFKLFRDFQDLILSPSPTGVIMKSDDYKAIIILQMRQFLDSEISLY